MSSAGFRLVAGRIPGERIATTTATTDSATFTTSDTTVMSVTGALVDGRTYRVRWWGRFETTVANDEARLAVREDSQAGSEKQVIVHKITRTSSFANPTTLECLYTAAATASKTFVLVARRFTGSGTLNLDAASTGPAYFTIDYISG